MWNWMHGWWWLGVGGMVLFWASVVWSIVYLNRYWSDVAARSKLDEHGADSEIDEVESRGSRELIGH